MQKELFVINIREENIGGIFMNSKKLIRLISEKISKIDIVIICLAALVIVVGISPQL